MDALANQAIVVTGATGGIGAAIVEQLYALATTPVTIIGACRRAQALDLQRARLAATYPNSPAMLLHSPLDLSTRDAARCGADAIKELCTGSGLQIAAIINNAGTMPMNRTLLSPEGLDLAMQVNCISTLAFTLKLAPELPPYSAIVFTSSITRMLPTLSPDFLLRGTRATGVASRMAAYGRSKLVLTFCAAQLAEQYAARRVRINCADPGVVDTGITRLGYPLADRLADLIARPLMSRPAQGAQAAIAALRTPLTGMMCTRSSIKPLRSLSEADRKVAETAISFAQQ